MATTYLNSPNGTGTDPQIATFSMWFKLTKPEADECYLFSGGDGASNNSWLRIQGSDGQLYLRNRTSGSNDCVIRTNAQHRDVNGWYHVVLKLNSTLGTAADRATMYVNGQEVTNLAANTDMTQNNLFHMFGSTTTHIGKRVNDGSTGNVGGFLASHVHFCDGYAYDASYFGSTDSTTGEWKINTSPSVTYGTRGFFILKDGNTITDSSPNSNNFTLGGGTLTKTEDCPSNVFATLNPLIYESRSNTFSNGNLKITGGVAGDWSTHYGVSTLGMSSGKYYVEAKITTAVGSQAMLGIIKTSQALSGSLRDIGTACIDAGGRISGGGGDFQTGLTSFASGDIAGASFDATNGTIQFYRNGSAYGNAISSIVSDTYYFATNSYDTGAVVEFNFGNGYFGTTAVSSAGTNASGNGIFEYDVPTGYTALSTKGLNL